MYSTWARPAMSEIIAVLKKNKTRSLRQLYFSRNFIFFNECFTYKVQILVSCTATRRLGLPQTDQNGIFPLGSVDYPNICFVVRSTLYVNMMLISFIQKSWSSANDLTSYEDGRSFLKL